MKKFKKTNKKILSITQILILIIGILSFAYLIGITSNEIKVVSAQGLEGETCKDKNANYCAITYNNPNAICNEVDNRCEEGVDVEYEGGKTKVPKNKSGSAEDALGYINTIAGTSLTLKQLFSIGGKAVPSTTTAGTTIAGAGGSSVWSQLFTGGGGAMAQGEGTAFSSVSTTGSMTLNVLGSALAAAATAAAIYFIFKAAGAGQQNLDMILNAGIVGASIGFAASFVAWGLIAGATGPVGWVAAAVTLVVMQYWILFSYQNYVLEIINYQISAWQPQSGGAKCEECNKLEYGCTEYQCRTFGQGCGIVNNGTKQERCVWQNPDDRDYPVIIEDAEISELPENYIFKKSTDISPPDTGVEITSNSQKCIPPFSSLTLGVKTDEPAQCRISTAREKEFDKMVRDMDEGTLQIEKHTKILPNSATANDWALTNLIDASALPEDTEFEITKGNEYEYYIKCKDTNGNENPANFVIKFCVQDKDLTAPIIKNFFVADGSFVQFGTSNVTTEVYTNEPTECKWDFSDKKYGDMQYGMANCDTTINQATVSGNSCTGTFTGLKNGAENKYYIRCQDRSEDKNTNSVSEVYTLKVSSQPVLINSISVNGKGNNSIIKDARDFIPVDLEIKTSFGAEDGKAKCSYEYLGNQILMSFNYVEISAQTLWLPEGEHTLPISCNDIAGDTDTGSIFFKVVKDREAPVVARAYYDANNLKIISNEPAECVYTTQTNIACAYEFKDGTAMNEIGESTHYTSWQANKKYFIKCKDAFGNQPLPGECSIIVKAFESFK